MKKRFLRRSSFLFLFSILFMSMTLLSGCVTEYKRSDIQKIVREDMGIKNAVVSDTYREFEGEDGYTDRIWTITVNDSGLVFNIIDDYHWGMESLTNSLKNDYNEALLAFIQDNLPDLKYLKINTYQEDGIYYGEIIGEYNNAEELKNCKEELDILKQSFSDLGYPDAAVRYRFEYQHPLRNVTEYVIDDADVFGRTDTDESYKSMLNEYITTVLDYRYDDLKNFTDEQIETALADYQNRIGVYTGIQSDEKLYEKDKITYYDDIIANKYYYGISFGSLYEILLREGYEPTGDFWHYSFVGKDESVYEISYDFCDYQFLNDDKTGYRNGYYYIKDGEKIPMFAYFYNHFTTKEIYEMTGLKLVDIVETE